MSHDVSRKSYIFALTEVHLAMNLAGSAHMNESKNHRAIFRSCGYIDYVYTTDPSCGTSWIE